MLFEKPKSQTEVKQVIKKSADGSGWRFWASRPKDEHEQVAQPKQQEAKPSPARSTRIVRDL